MRINLQALRYFEMVARYEHFTKAANELFITQSTLSKAIDSLERDIGVKLFEKQGRNVRLTNYGRFLRDYVQRGIKELETGIQLTQNMANIESGVVRISTIYSAGSFLLPNLIKGFSNQHPEVKFHYSQKPTYRILDDLLNGEIDLGFVNTYEETEEYNKLHRETISTEELCLIVPQDHPLADRETVSFDDVAGETWIGYSGDTGMATTIKKIAKAAGYKKFTFSYFASEDFAIIGLVRAGLGISIIPAKTEIITDEVKKIKITQPYFYRSIYMMWDPSVALSPASKAFRRYILSTI